MIFGSDTSLFRYIFFLLSLNLFYLDFSDHLSALSAIQNFYGILLSILWSIFNHRRERCSVQAYEPWSPRRRGHFRPEQSIEDKLARGLLLGARGRMLVRDKRPFGGSKRPYTFEEKRAFA